MVYEWSQNIVDKNNFIKLYYLGIHRKVLSELDNLSLFQNWILAISFRDHITGKTLNEFAMQWCDSSLTDDLQENRIKDYLTELLELQLLEAYSIQNDLLYKITPPGILYVRKRLVKPIIDFTYSSNFSEISNKLKDTNNKELINNLDPNEEKSNISSKLINFAIDNIGPTMSLISSILDL